VPLAIATLKLPFGALAALLGLVLIHDRFIPGLTDLDSWGQILAYAIALGIAQHAVIVLIDRRGHELLAGIPGKRTASEPERRFTVVARQGLDRKNPPDSGGNDESCPKGCTVASAAARPTGTRCEGGKSTGAGTGPGRPGTQLTSEPPVRPQPVGGNRATAQALAGGDLASVVTHGADAGNRAVASRAPRLDAWYVSGDPLAPYTVFKAARARTAAPRPSMHRV
jgi:hypothetical protein